MKPEMIANILATLALGFSIYTFFRQKTYAENQDRLNKILTEKELQATQIEKKADLGASLFQSGSKGGYRIKIWNKGRASAKNVKIEFPEGNEIINESELRSKFPLEALEPQAGVELWAIVHMGTKPKHVVKLLWDDIDERNEKVVHLTI
jgi:hypothetical protein